MPKTAKRTGPRGESRQAPPRLNGSVYIPRYSVWAPPIGG